jgi:hypothetical protein
MGRGSFPENLGNSLSQHARVETPGANGNDFDGLGRVYKTKRRGPSVGQEIVVDREAWGSLPALPTLRWRHSRRLLSGLWLLAA